MPNISTEVLNQLISGNKQPYTDILLSRNTPLVNFLWLYSLDQIWNQIGEPNLNESQIYGLLETFFLQNLAPYLASSLQLTNNTKPLDLLVRKLAIIHIRLLKYVENMGNVKIILKANAGDLIVLIDLDINDRQWDKLLHREIGRGVEVVDVRTVYQEFPGIEI